MKSRYWMCFTAIALFAALAMPVPFAAQQQAKTRPHYRFVDLGTLGGPNSSFGGFAQVLNNVGTAVGEADTSTPDPYYPNFNPILQPAADPFLMHAFQSKKSKKPLTDLGSLAGVNASVPIWVNASGETAGASENGSIDPLTGWPEANAVVWAGAKVINLGTLGGNESFAGPINDKGQVAGAAANSMSDPYSIFGFGTQTRGFIWEKGKQMRDLGDLGGPDTVALYLNQSGQIAGFSYTSGTPNSVTTPCGTNIPTEDPFLWENDKMTDIGTLGGTCGFANALNNLGQVVGQSDLKGDGCCNYHPFFWKKGMKNPRDLGTFGGPVGSANWINDAGAVVGYATLNGVQHHAFLWKKGQKKLKDLGILKGDTCDAAYGINSKTQVIGDSGLCGSGVFRPFLWQNGSIYDLSTAFPSGHFQSAGAEFINDSGEIAGTGVLSNRDTHAYLLIPCKAGTKGCKGVAAGSAAVPRSRFVSSDASSQTPTGYPMRQAYRYGWLRRAIGSTN
jgi:probable HAF family extracellular repeat protein